MNRSFSLRIFAVAGTFLTCCAPTFCAQRTSATVPAAELRPLSPEIASRAQKLHQSLQPSARAWVDQEAHSNPGRTLDQAAIRADVLRRFAPASGASLSNMDVDALVAVVLQQSSSGASQDLQQIMQQMQAINQAKDALRNIEDQVNKNVAAMQPGKNSTPCSTPACLALPGELANIAAVTARTPHPIRTTLPPNATYQQMANALSQLQSDTDSLSDISQEQQLKLQMAQQAYSQAMEAVSNIMKSTSDTRNSIIGNMK